MYKLLLVDDRKKIVDGIANSVNWQEYDIEPSTCYNGKDALEFVLSEKVDIVVTDIKMPFMSGIELLEQCKLHGVSTRFIILSGYDDFAYAKKGISLGVSEYLLKPVKIDDLLRSVLKVLNSIQKEESLAESIKKLHRHEVQSVPMLKAAFFKKLVEESNLSRENVCSQMEFLNLSIKLDHVCLVLFSIDAYAQIVEEYNEAEIEILRFAISNIAKEIFEEKYVVELFNYGQQQVVAVLNFDPKVKTIVHQYDIYHLSQKIQQAVNEYIKRHITVAISDCCCGDCALPHAYQQCVDMMSHALYLNENVIIVQSDVIQRKIEAAYNKNI